MRRVEKLQQLLRRDNKAHVWINVWGVDQTRVQFYFFIFFQQQNEAEAELGGGMLHFESFVVFDFGFSFLSH